MIATRLATDKETDESWDIFIYCTRTIITRGLYIFYPIFEDHFFVFKEFFHKIISLCMVSIQERFLIKSGL